jgi:exosortase
MINFDLSNKRSNFVNISPLLILECAVFFIVFSSVLRRLISTWSNSENYSHGFFIIPISIYLIWMKKDRVLETPKNNQRIGFYIFLFGLLIYVVANYAYITTLASMAMLITLYGMILYLYGFQMFRLLAFPLFFLILMIPVPEQIYSSLTIPLQLFVSKTSTDFAMLLNIPIFRQGNVIQLPEQVLEVVQACSGLRSVVSLLAVSAVFGYLRVNSNYLRSIIFFSSIPIAIIVNIFRVIIMIIASYYFQYDLSQGTIHTIFGMIIFALALVILFSLGKGLSFWDKSDLKN